MSSTYEAPNHTPARGTFSAWGKLRRAASGVVDGFHFHPLLDHMTDVAACFIALAGCLAFRRAMQQAAGRDLNAADIERLAVLVFLHDIGKANAGFQSRRWIAPERPPGRWPTQPYGHGPEGWALVSGAVSTAEQVLAGLPLDEMAGWGDEAAMQLWQASISHHGRPVGEEPAKQSVLVWQPVLNARGEFYDPGATVADMGQRLRQCYPLAFSPCRQALPEASAFVHLFAGLVQLADWLGSDTRDGFFPYTEPGEDRTQTAPERAAFAVRAIGLDVSPWRRALAHQTPTFATAFRQPAPRPMQTAAANLSLGDLVILEAETGSGKTEAALWRFAQLFQEGTVDGLYFALPTRVIVTRDVADRFHGFLASVMLEVAPNIFIMPRMTKAVRERTWAVIADWHSIEPRGSAVMVWRDLDQAGGIGLAHLGTPARELVEMDGMWLTRRSKLARVL